MFCLSKQDIGSHDVDSLSPYARAWIRHAFFEDGQQDDKGDEEKEGQDKEEKEQEEDEEEQEQEEQEVPATVVGLRDDYEKHSGLQWNAATSAADRIAQTTQLPHETAMRQEIDAFTVWLEDIKYIELDDVSDHPTYHWLPAIWEWWQYFGPKPTTSYYMDLYIDCIYDVFRVRPNTTPVSLPVLVEMRRLQRHLKLWVQERREKLELTEEEKERALAAAREEKYKRVMRGVKRGREADVDVVVPVT